MHHSLAQDIKRKKPLIEPRQNKATLLRKQNLEGGYGLRRVLATIITRVKSKHQTRYHKERDEQTDHNPRQPTVRW